MTDSKNEQKHTPGKWRRDHASIIDADGKVIALVTSTNAIGNLMAATPELLAVCKCALADLEGLTADQDTDSNSPARCTIMELRTAIAKANKTN